MINLCSVVTMGHPAVIAVQLNVGDLGEPTQAHDEKKLDKEDHFFPGVG